MMIRRGKQLIDESKILFGQPRICSCLIAIRSATVTNQFWRGGIDSTQQEYVRY